MIGATLRLDTGQIQAAVVGLRTFCRHGGELGFSDTARSECGRISQLLGIFIGDVEVSGPIVAAGVEAEHVTVRNEPSGRTPEGDDLHWLIGAAARAVGDRRTLSEVDAQAGCSGEDRDLAVVHLERSLNELADVLSVVINRQERRNA